MSEIHVSCKDQVLKLTKAPIIASGGVNETKVVFTFCEKWDGFVKTALFYVDADHKYYAILDENNICILPWEVCAENGSFYFTVFGEKDDIRRTASVVKYKVGKGVEVDEMFPSDPTPEVYDQIIALLLENKELTENFISEAGASIEAANEATVNANAIAQDMEEKRDSGYFNGEKGDPGDKDAVLYTEQTLTEVQKIQARENIGAASQAEAAFFFSRLADGSLVLVDTKEGDDYTLHVHRGKLKLEDSTILTNEDEQRIREEAKAGAVLYTQQDLTEGQKADARQNIGALGGDEIANVAVLYKSQDLTEKQAETARYNIGAASNDEVVKFSEDQKLTEEQKAQARANIGAVSADEIPEGGGGSVDLTGYVKDTDYATADKAGVVKAGAGLSMVNGAIQIEYARENQITNKSTYRSPITPVYLDLAVKTGITTNQIALTAEEQQAAKDWLGVVEGGGGTGGDVEIPETLPNPHKLTFTGAVNAEYDGSTPVEVNIPAGGGGGAEPIWEEVVTHTIEAEATTWSYGFDATDEILVIATGLKCNKALVCIDMCVNDDVLSISNLCMSTGNILHDTSPTTLRAHIKAIDDGLFKGEHYESGGAAACVWRGGIGIHSTNNKTRKITKFSIAAQSYGTNKLTAGTITIKRRVN